MSNGTVPLNGYAQFDDEREMAKKHGLVISLSHFQMLCLLVMRHH